MEAAIKALAILNDGYATVLWDQVVIRIGNRYIIGVTVDIRSEGVDLNTAAAILARH